MPTLKHLYYLSKTPLELLIPRPSGFNEETQNIPHICFSESIQGCLNKEAVVPGDRFKVYTIVADNYHIPLLSEVPDKNITEEVWISYAVEPELLYEIEVLNEATTYLEEVNSQLQEHLAWKYKIVEDASALTEDTRTLLVAKSRSAGPYKNQMRGKNRFERKKHSQIAKTVKQYNKIDMNKFFKEDILEVAIPVIGETDSYTVNIRMEGIVKEIATNIKNNKNKLEYRTIVQSITKIFNTANIFVKCSCPDYKYRFAHWNIVNKVSVDDSSKDPGPGKGIRNPKDNKGRGCKHVLLVLANGDWIMKVASVINNYIHYAEKNLQKPFLKLIFPKLYNIPFEDAVEKDLLPDDFKLETSTDIIDVINEYGRNRGKYKPGTNKNPVTGTGGKQKAAKAEIEKPTPEEPKEVTKKASKPEPKPAMPEEDIEDNGEKDSKSSTPKSDEQDQAETEKK